MLTTRLSGFLFACVCIIGISACDSSSGDEASDWEQAQGNWIRLQDGVPVNVNITDVEGSVLRVSASVIRFHDKNTSGDCFEGESLVIVERDGNTIDAEVDETDSGEEGGRPITIRLTVDEDVLTFEILDSPNPDAEGQSLQYARSERSFMPICEA